jgi:hypothetical protein
MKYAGDENPVSEEISVMVLFVVRRSFAALFILTKFRY